jgi:hypothetical protein
MGSHLEKDKIESISQGIHQNTLARNQGSKCKSKTMQVPSNMNEYEP